MTDPLSWSIPLGRWAGVSLRAHLTLILFICFRLFFAIAIGDEETDRLTHLGETAAWLSLLIIVLLIHEAGHCAAAYRFGLEPGEINLWPLGNLVRSVPSTISNSREAITVALMGPLVNLLLAAFIYIGLLFADAQMVLYPFGYNGEGNGAPTVNGEPVKTFGIIWWIGWFGFLNWLVFLANLIPAIPMDGGRALRAYLAQPALVSTRDGLIAPWTARTCAVLLGIIGLARILLGREVGGFSLISLAFLFEIMVRRESWMIEEGSEIDDNLFGYDFSEGYTSLEGSGPKVRPYQESALTRWRRRRSEARRRRRVAQQAAEEQRMDEILAKIHSEGRDSLSSEEQRFLVRVSHKYRNRSDRS